MCLFSFNLMMAARKFGSSKYGLATLNFSSHFYIELWLKNYQVYIMQDFIKSCIFQK